MFFESVSSLRILLSKALISRMFRQAVSRSSGALYVGGGVLAGAVGSVVSETLDCRAGPCVFSVLNLLFPSPI